MYELGFAVSIVERELAAARVEKGLVWLLLIYIFLYACCGFVPTRVKIIFSSLFFNYSLRISANVVRKSK